MIPNPSNPPSKKPLLLATAATVATTPAPDDVITVPLVHSTDDGLTITHSCLATICWGEPLTGGFVEGEQISDWLLAADFDAVTLPIETGDRIHVFSREDIDPAYLVAHERNDQTDWIAFRQPEPAIATAFSLVGAIRASHVSDRQSLPTTPSAN